MSARNVYLFVFDTMADWETSFAAAGISNPRDQKSPDRYRLITVGAARKPVVTMSGLRVVPDITLSDIETNHAAMLILPGGETWETHANMAAIDVARSFFIKCIPVAAICGATFALARAGMLDDHHHTSNSRDYLIASGYRGEKFYCDIPAIADEGVITASGLNPLEFAREIFKTLDLYTPSALAAWYSLHKFGSATRYQQLANCAA
ncbi:DJ-1/PfpI family protein [Occallatibacter savannae]|uniref:DJ-1/PfpI family protein n=1 Tax=Occallatibacter savannae TaxID=1002691 RepID=UPI000D68FADC|nr:DJ-1/PfpI family protein [Occallatibacter savannae]